MFCCTGKKKKEDVLKDVKILKKLNKSYSMQNSNKLVSGSTKIYNQTLDFCLFENELVIIQNQKIMSDNKYIDLKQKQLTFSTLFDKDFREQDKQIIGIKFIAYTPFKLKSEKEEKIKSLEESENKKYPEISLMIDNKSVLNRLMQILKNKIYFTDFRYSYKTIEILGEGSSGTVFNIVNRNNLNQYAAKVIPKLELSKEENAYEAIQQEIQLMLKVQSKFVIKLHEVYEDENNLYLVLDLFNGGSLQDIIDKGKKKRKFNIKDIQTIMQQIIQGVNDLHDSGIMHRDIKPENIILKKEGKYDLVLCDLGLATEYDLEQYLFQNVGTPGYVAPEVYYEKHKYSPLCDIYSCGIILYQLYFDNFPFKGKNMQQILEQNKKSEIHLDQLSVNSKSDSQVIDLLQQMLTETPKNRINGIDILKHPFFQLTEEDRTSLTDTSKLSKASTDINRSPLQNGKKRNSIQNQPISPTKIKQKLRKQIEKDYNFKLPNTPLMGKRAMQVEQMQNQSPLFLQENQIRKQVDSINISFLHNPRKSINSDQLRQLRELNASKSRSGSPQLDNASALLKQTLKNNQSRLEEFNLQDSNSGGKQASTSISNQIMRLKQNSIDPKIIQQKQNENRDVQNELQQYQNRQKVNTCSPAVNLRSPVQSKVEKQSKFYTPQQGDYLEQNKKINKSNEQFQKIDIFEHIQNSTRSHNSQQNSDKKREDAKLHQILQKLE